MDRNISTVKKIKKKIKKKADKANRSGIPPASSPSLRKVSLSSGASNVAVVVAPLIGPAQKPKRILGRSLSRKGHVSLPVSFLSFSLCVCVCFQATGHHRPPSWRPDSASLSPLGCTKRARDRLAPFVARGCFLCGCDSKGCKEHVHHYGPSPTAITGGGPWLALGAKGGGIGGGGGSRDDPSSILNLPVLVHSVRAAETGLSRWSRLRIEPKDHRAADGSKHVNIRPAILT